MSLLLEWRKNLSWIQHLVNVIKVPPKPFIANIPSDETLILLWYTLTSIMNKTRMLAAPARVAQMALHFWKSLMRAIYPRLWFFSTWSTLSLDCLDGWNCRTSYDVASGVLQHHFCQLRFKYQEVQPNCGSSLVR